jgi:hypothetical protein
MPSVNQPFAFEGDPLYQEAMAFAYACMRRVQSFPSGYGVYADELQAQAVSICQQVARALSRRSDEPPTSDYQHAREAAVACVPIIDLLSTVGLIRGGERTALRDRLAAVVSLLDNQRAYVRAYIQEEVR